MNRNYLRLLFIFVFSFFTFVAFADQNPGEIFKAQVENAKKSVESIEPKELMNWIIDKKDFLVIDVREKNEVEAGKIEVPNYMHTPRGLVDIIGSKGALKTDQVIVVYCKLGSRGLLAAKTLKDLGFKNVYNLEGGIQNWMQAGLPITNSLGTFKTVPYEFTGCGEK